VRKIKVQGLFVVATLTLCMVVVSAHAQTYSDLYNFGDASGDPLNPQYSGIIARVMATFTARLRQAEARGLGTVFNITAQGAMSVLYNFDGTHGKFPYGGLTLGTDGNFYGTTSVGGSTNLGVIFKITRAGAFEVSPEFHFVAYDAGHILGSTSLELTISENGRKTVVVFSGDIGRYNQPILNDPVTPSANADVLLCESTYGDRDHEAGDPAELLAAVVNRVAGRGGSIVIPAFAIGRTQTFMYYLRELGDQQKIPHLPVYVDSPMALSATDLYVRHREDHDLEFSRIESGNGGKGDPLSVHEFHLTRTADESKAAPAQISQDDWDILNARVDEQRQVKVESMSRYRVKLSGLALFTAFANYGQVDNTSLPSIALPPIAGYSSGSVGASVRQSIIGLTGYGPTLFGAHTSADMPAVDVSAPARSSLTARRCPRASSRGVTAMTAAPTGTLTKKTQRQDAYSVMMPPRTRPSEAPPMATAVKAPRARTRSRPSGKLLTIVARTPLAGFTKLPSVYAVRPMRPPTGARMSV